MPLWKLREEFCCAPTRPVLFLDRDGVLIEDRHYLADPAGVVLVPGVVEGLRLAREAGFQLVGVSNQSGIGRGRFTEQEFAAVMERLDSLLEEAGCPLDAFFYCPHAPGDGCACRKPRPGMLDEWGGVRDWSRDGSWVIGDKGSDLDLGRDAGLGACLVRTGYGAETEAEQRHRYAGDDLVLFADDLRAAVEAILSRERGNGP